MRKSMLEFQGLYDTVVQVSKLVAEGCTFDSIGGVGSEYFYYLEVIPAEGESYVKEVFGRTALFQTIEAVVKDGGRIDLNTLGASGGRNATIWCVCTGEDEKPLTDVVVPPEEPKQEEPEPIEEPTVEISPAAKEFADLHAIDLSKVKGSGKKGKITKPDIVKYFDNQMP